MAHHREEDQKQEDFLKQHNKRAVVTFEMPGHLES